MVDKTEIVTAGQGQDALHCLTIPLTEDIILLPNAAVSEIVAYIAPYPAEETPDWLLGNIMWRDIQVPLVSFEAVGGKDVETANKNSRIAVLNTLNGNAKVPYIGILSQGIPSIALIQEEGIEEQEDENNRATVGAVVNVGGIEALIPNIDELEQLLESLNL